ncbi:class I SAM-dependent methyltransferase [Ectopseudomonas toyotomiensis]|uniref:Methyltransferase domain-containing protein n=1 Tax=Ectopseudomonas toyotomiensis TaxID=554344 RepID=A0A1I5RCJ7_9GAMM|nr:MULTISPECIES: class I SAM-dependent methyltransferase [Pseudomonas]PIA74588.1 class I SAM-dependent methyltransferase [Pseudomonas toyotomiensis]SFP56253.1 Methyltransferase domain-containing protein [Pseudomonas toyotomiensis]
MKVFDQYARYYDLLYRDKDYHGEADFILSLLRRYAPGSKAIFEMGCGTGIHAKMFVEAGHSVHGIDLSDTMLKAAILRREALVPDMRERLAFSPGDVRSYRSGRKFDVVLSLFHVFSYQNENADLQAAFSTAATHLDAGGIFIFDYWYGPAVLAQRPETRVKRLDDGELSVLRIAESLVYEQRNVVEVNYETYIRTADAADLIREKHCMRYLFLPEIELLAELHGFEPVAHRAWLSDSEPSIESWASFSILRKK